MKPTIGRIVIYRSRTGDYDVPAIITATADTLNTKGVEAYRSSGGTKGVPRLSGEDHVHLTVLTPGLPGQRAGADDFLVESPVGRGENTGGTYQEWDIPFDGLVAELPAGNPDDVAPGTWRWPTINR